MLICWCSARAAVSFPYIKWIIWNVSSALQICAALLILAHPAAFFLVAGYSESLFLMALLGFVYWSSAEGRSAKILAAASIEA